uniref:Peptidase S1 domain-containing protein n=1 Tax=Anopheles dirus TaxID=7168 RepID=A0A182NND0_9DIPT
MNVLAILSIVQLSSVALAAPNIFAKTNNHVSHHSSASSYDEGGERIVGGQEIDIADVPFQVSVQTFGVHTCGGSIITVDPLQTIVKPQFAIYYAAHLRSATTELWRAG